MKFCVDSIILWPKNRDFPYKRHSFVDGKVNVITGASRTGKSAIIPIIDYCLGSQKCTIPVNTIRNACEWFGVLFQLEQEQVLLCRREPGKQQTTGEMYFSRGKAIVIPTEITSNTTSDEVRNILNELFGMSFLEIDPSAGGFSTRPSYRDLMAFIFQPQNIVANADVMFYKADTMEHRQRLINIFPYVLGAVTPEILAARQTLERLRKQRDRVQRDLNTLRDVSEQWKQEVASWVSRALELGLAEEGPDPELPFERQVEFLADLVETQNMESLLRTRNVLTFSKGISELRKQEQELSSELFVLQKRRSDMLQLKDSAASYNSSLQIQRDRLEISDWIRQKYVSGTKCPFCLEKHSGVPDTVEQLCNAIAEIEEASRSLQTMPAAFEREMQQVENEIQITTESLQAIRERINSQSSANEADAKSKYTLQSIARFLGRLETSLLTYSRIGKDAKLEGQLKELTESIEELERVVDERKIKKDTESAIRYVDLAAGKIIEKLDSEHPNDPIEFVIKDLTLKVHSGHGRADYLWEIGSASNWLSYHIAVILAFQRFFHEKETLNMPSFIVFDQPSQVYFPRTGLRKKEDNQEVELKDEDKDAVRKVFSALSQYISDSKGKMQIIVTEHADEDIWGDIPEIHVAGKWRGREKLVPMEWLNE